MRLADIAVRVEPPAATGGLGDGVAAVLSEVAGLLERLAATGEGASIDLRSLPLAPADRAVLERALGEGEVEAALSADGASTIRETGVPGVWWLEYRDAGGALIAELLEVARVPHILARAPDEIAAAAGALRARVGSPAPVGSHWGARDAD
jgi:hydrogenase-1 operon protein HyaF